MQMGLKLHHGVDVVTAAVGDTTSTPLQHPTLALARERRRQGSRPGQRTDSEHLALVIEGGGMRGCITAGMASALVHYGYMDAFDSVWGSSAGSMIGAYAMSRPHVALGSSLYTDLLTGTGTHFIDTSQFLRTIGLGALALPKTGLSGLRDLRDKFGKPVLKLDYLLRDALQVLRPLDWSRFSEYDKLQPLHIVASGVTSRRPVVLSSAAGQCHGRSGQCQADM